MLFGHFLPFRPVLLFLGGRLGESAQLMTDNFQLRNQSVMKQPEKRPFVEPMSSTNPFLQVSQLQGHLLRRTLCLRTAFALRGGGRHSLRLCSSLVGTGGRDKATFQGDLHISGLKNLLRAETVSSHSAQVSFYCNNQLKNRPEAANSLQ